MKIYSFYIKDDQNVNYLGKDFSQILDENFDKARKFIQSVDVEEDGKRIKAKIKLNTGPMHRIEIQFDIPSFDKVLYSMEIGDKAVRKDNELKRFSPSDLNTFFRNLDQALYTLAKKESFREDSRMENNETFMKLIDAINKFLVY